jgi:hypothetical protein
MNPRRILPLLGGLALAACSAVGVRSGTEEPTYRVLAHVGAAEIREYGPRLAAETVVQGSEEASRSAGFRRLAGYIFGANQTNSKIAMTAPVVQQGDKSEKIAMTAPVSQHREADGAWRIRFFMPAQYTLATLPKPTNPAVHIVAVPPERYAVYRFSGRATPGAVAAAQQTLVKTLQSGGWQPVGDAAVWLYDPPWTLPPLRRNEAVVPVMVTTP